MPTMRETLRAEAADLDRRAKMAEDFPVSEAELQARAAALLTLATRMDDTEELARGWTGPGMAPAASAWMALLARLDAPVEP